MAPPRPTTAIGAWSSLRWPEQRASQRLTGVPEGVSIETLALTHLPASRHDRRCDDRPRPDPVPDVDENSS
ncbi:unnamed protein product [Phytophthora lilii]|uniref:Unnamed protein product n=1 Tax=Phytophthora lilii TaxID=2077276 RepID=A0A9W7CFB1_9STRA|nr:unnamed protein product [Phytophthora lilii]